MPVDPNVRAQLQVVQEELVTLAAPLADQVRNQLGHAVERGDVEAVRREGNDWSGHVGLSILRLSDEMEKHRSQTH